MTQCEEDLQKAFQELNENPQVQIFYGEKGPLAQEFGDAASTFEMISSWRGIELDKSLQRCFIRFTVLTSHWRIEGPGVKLAGEFRIRHPLYSLDVRAPDSDWPSNESEEKLYSELRVIDDRPGSGGGDFTGMRIQPDNTKPELWYHDFRRGTYKLDIDYCQYLNTLCVTKGVWGWQYLFTDVSLTERDFRSFALNLEKSLEILPRLFPDHDYTDLRTRLQERL
ncbi:hypothetical protein PUR57_32275 [Streptomyces sp. JV176]|uniref:hypothetical protein n=1 Tax=Streptomyces sp. JV176 TaxID=858630 RepID=UPI002E7969C5|nr:hypothetical protein [Streptomyces sp. JV176]MEE1803291.1 hypothetical protein [Streptomyces sp. JV176]